MFHRVSSHQVLYSGLLFTVVCRVFSTSHVLDDISIISELRASKVDFLTGVGFSVFDLKQHILQSCSVLHIQQSAALLVLQPLPELSLAYYMSPRHNLGALPRGGLQERTKTQVVFQPVSSLLKVTILTLMSASWSQRSKSAPHIAQVSHARFAVLMSNPLVLP